MRRPRPTFASVTSLLALVVALGGTGYAASQLPRNSVASTQVKDHSLLAKDVKRGQLLGAKGTAVKAKTAANASKLAGRTPSQLTYATSGTSYFNTTTGSDTTVVVTTHAPAAGQLQYTVAVACDSQTGTTASTVWYVDPTLDGTDLVLDNTLAGSLLTFVDTSPHIGDSTSVTGQVAVTAGTHTVGIVLTRASGDGSADCNVMGTTLFAADGEVNPSPISRPATRSGARG